MLDTGITDFGATFPARIHAFLEDVTNGVPREQLRSSGRDALATLEYTWAAIESTRRAARWCGRTAAHAARRSEQRENLNGGDPAVWP